MDVCYLSHSLLIEAGSGTISRRLSSLTWVWSLKIPSCCLQAIHPESQTIEDFDFYKRWCHTTPLTGAYEGGSCYFNAFLVSFLSRLKKWTTIKYREQKNKYYQILIFFMLIPDLSLFSQGNKIRLAGKMETLKLPLNPVFHHCPPPRFSVQKPAWFWIWLMIFHFILFICWPLLGVELCPQ